MRKQNKIVAFFSVTSLIVGVFVLVGLAFSPLAKAQVLQVNDTSCPSGKLCNPIGSSSIADLLLKVSDAVLKIGVPIAAVFIIFAGLKFVTAAGDTKAIDDAKRIFWYTIIGTAILLGATVLAKVLLTTINSISS